MNIVYMFAQFTYLCGKARCAAGVPLHDNPKNYAIETMHAGPLDGQLICL